MYLNRNIVIQLPVRWRRATKESGEKYVAMFSPSVNETSFLKDDYKGRRAKVIAVQFNHSSFAAAVQLKDDPYQAVDPAIDVVAQFDDGLTVITSGTFEPRSG